ncbi:MAG TPA: BamA/TamA family outer membrane protein [Vicinamibacterales bacterium]|nr:BamA/TamA family outer membrane protein [Vicinamibacterales bacterium]
MTAALVLLAWLACAAPDQPPRPNWPRLPVPAQDEPRRGPFPLVGSVVQGSSLALGGGYRDHGLFGSPVGFDVSGMVSVRGYRVYRARVGLLHAEQSSTGLQAADEEVTSLVEDDKRVRVGGSAYLDARYRYYPRVQFFGTGPGAREEDRTGFRVRGASVDLVLQRQITPSFAVSSRAGFLESRVDRGRDDRWPATQDVFTPEQAPGVQATPNYFVAGGGAALDTRDDPHQPRQGFFLSGAAWRFDARRESRFSFTRVAFDARGFVKPVRSPGVVAVRALAATDLVSEGHAVPFFLQPGLGGRESLRGFPVGRWRDRALAHASIEYRLRPHPLLEVAPFADAGVVGPGLGALDAGRVQFTPGIALRALWRGEVLGRMEWAWGRDGGRLLFGIGQVF